MNKELERIANVWLNTKTLETKTSSEDFYECAVWNIREALESAYKLGIKENETKYNQLKKAIKDFHKAKNRYHSQIACAKLFELAGLPAQYPENYIKNENTKS